jgi:murein DD-endopeptidase MepM/ murein hydrolase activator NlpD
MRTTVVAILLLLACNLSAQDLEVAVRPDAIYVESIAANIVPMERVFFHIVIHNVSKNAEQLNWLRYDVVNSDGILFSGQYSGAALAALFDSAIDRKRIEPTPKGTLALQPDERKAISDIFLDFPKGFIGQSMIVEVDYKSDGKGGSQKISTPLKRVDGFSARLPFDGVWYVAAEHGYLDPHKRFFAEAYAYDFIQVGLNGKAYQRDGNQNMDYYAYGKKVLAAKDGTIVYVRTDITDNDPGDPNLNTPGGNVVIIDHGNSQFGYYAHLRARSVSVKVGAKVKAGDPIGEVGNSGDSSEPHLHFHVMNARDPEQADGIPVVFEKWKTQAYSRFPIERQQGVIPRGEFVQP